MINEYIRFRPCLQMSWISTWGEDGGNEKRTGQSTDELKLTCKNTKQVLLSLKAHTMQHLQHFNSE